MRSGAAKDIDEYLAAVPSDAFRAALGEIRRIVHEEVPEAEETISYGMPAFKLNGTFVWFAAFKNHCSLFAGYTDDLFVEELKDFVASKGTIKFTPDHPIPEQTVRKIIRARVAKNLAKKASKKRAGG